MLINTAVSGVYNTLRAPQSVALYYIQILGIVRHISRSFGYYMLPLQRFNLTTEQGLICKVNELLINNDTEGLSPCVNTYG